MMIKKYELFNFYINFKKFVECYLEMFIYFDEEFVIFFELGFYIIYKKCEEVII